MRKTLLLPLPNTSKSKNLENFGVQELTTVEQRELDGGSFWTDLAFYLLSEWDSIKEGNEAWRREHGTL